MAIDYSTFVGYFQVRDQIFARNNLVYAQSEERVRRFVTAQTVRCLHTEFQMRHGKRRQAGLRDLLNRVPEAVLKRFL